MHTDLGAVLFVGAGLVLAVSVAILAGVSAARVLFRASAELTERDQRG